jgi:hypothetical protein
MSTSSAGRHVTAQRWRQASGMPTLAEGECTPGRRPPRACQRRGGTPDRRLPHTPPARPRRPPPAPTASLTQACLGVTTCGVRSSPRRLSHGGRAPERSRRPTPGCCPEARLSPAGMGLPSREWGGLPLSVRRDRLGVLSSLTEFHAPTAVTAYRHGVNDFRQHPPAPGSDVPWPGPHPARRPVRISVARRPSVRESDATGGVRRRLKARSPAKPPA